MQQIAVCAKTLTMSNAIATPAIDRARNKFLTRSLNLSGLRLDEHVLQGLSGRSLLTLGSLENDEDSHTIEAQRTPGFVDYSPAPSSSVESSRLASTMPRSHYYMQQEEEELNSTVVSSGIAAVPEISCSEILKIAKTFVNAGCDPVRVHRYMMETVLKAGGSPPDYSVASKFMSAHFTAEDFELVMENAAAYDSDSDDEGSQDGGESDTSAVVLGSARGRSFVWPLLHMAEFEFGSILNSPARVLDHVVVVIGLPLVPSEEIPGISVLLSLLSRNTGRIAPWIPVTDDSGTPLIAGCAFLELPTANACHSAVRKLHGFLWDKSLPPLQAKLFSSRWGSAMSRPSTATSTVASTSTRSTWTATDNGQASPPHQLDTPQPSSQQPRVNVSRSAIVETLLWKEKASGVAKSVWRSLASAAAENRWETDDSAEAVQLNQCRARLSNRLDEALLAGDVSTAILSDQCLTKLAIHSAPQQGRLSLSRLLVPLLCESNGGVTNGDLSTPAITDIDTVASTAVAPALGNDTFCRSSPDELSGLWSAALTAERARSIALLHCWNQSQVEDEARAENKCMERLAEQRCELEELWSWRVETVERLASNSGAALAEALQTLQQHRHVMQRECTKCRERENTDMNNAIIRDNSSGSLEESKVEPKTLETMLSALSVSSMKDETLSEWETALEESLGTVRKERRSRAEFEKESTLCCACLLKPRAALLMPCRHLCLCLSCASHDMLDRCPMCRAPIDDVISVFS